MNNAMFEGPNNESRDLSQYIVLQNTEKINLGSFFFPNVVNHESAPKRIHRGIRRLVRLIGGWTVFDHTREVIITRGEHMLAQAPRLSNQKK